MTDIDTILTSVEQTLRDGLEFYLIVRTDRTFWEQNNKFRYRNAREVNDIIEESFDELYTSFPTLEKSFDDSVILLQECTWVGMNAPWPVDADNHIERVIDNVMNVYGTIVYGKLRTFLLD
jgi:hypothetical protein